MRRIPEFFTPHLERYVYACNYTLDKRVFDAGSKDGYGSVIMSNFAVSVTLSDINHKWLRQATAHNFLCPANFIPSDYEKEFPEGNWDVIVAFEIIEHLENPDFFLDNVKKALPSDGKLVFSIPHDADVVGHKHVYDEKKARDLMERHFNIEEWHIQDKSVIAGRPTLKVPTPLTYVGVAVI